MCAWRIRGLVGRPKRPRDLPMLPMRELGHAMEQIRNSCGFHRGAIDRLNQVVVELYPNAVDQRARAGPTSAPRLLVADDDLLYEVEQGKGDRPRDQRHWLRAEDLSDRQLRANRVPEWLVWAYDRAFCADGYLVDFYRWATAADVAHRSVPPRSESVTAIPRDALRGLMFRGFDGVAPDVQALLDAYVTELERRADSRISVVHGGPAEEEFGGIELADDGSASCPEGSVLLPGQTLIIRWIFRNVGTTAWRDRVLVRVGDHGMITPRFVPVPDTEPGATALVECPVRAPASHGTFRACLKMVWPDGSWCAPTTLLGVLITIIVPPAELLPGWRYWEQA